MLDLRCVNAFGPLESGLRCGAARSYLHTDFETSLIKMHALKWKKNGKKKIVVKIPWTCISLCIHSFVIQTIF